jgi:hypothetical protein
MTGVGRLLYAIHDDEIKEGSCTIDKRHCSNACRQKAYRKRGKAATTA